MRLLWTFKSSVAKVAHYLEPLLNFFGSFVIVVNVIDISYVSFGFELYSNYTVGEEEFLFVK